LAGDKIACPTSVVKNQAALDEFRSRLLFEDVLTVELRHALVLLLLFQARVARANLFFASRLGDSEAVEMVLLLCPSKLNGSLPQPLQ
jgi:hypothetical protein